MQIAPDGGELRQRAVRGAGVTVLSGGLGLGIQIVATVVLARLLAPKDFGLVAMVVTFSALLMNFGLNGFTEAVVQREEINHVLVSNLFWINLSGGLFLTIGFAASGSLLARFYNDPLVARVAAGMSLTIFLTSVSVLHLALLKRAMRFSLVSANDMLARAVSVVVSIFLGWAGWGYWALVAGAVAFAASTSIGAWVLCRWIPGRPHRGAATRPLIWFAISTYGRFSIGYFTNNLDNLLIGWRLGPTPLGFYKKAYDLFALPTSQLSAPLTIVAVSALSRLQRDYILYRRYLIGALGVMAFVGMGIGADLTLVGKDLIFLLLGSKWGETGRIFTFFGPGIGIRLLYGTHQWIHLSIGRADRWLRWGMIDLSVTAVFFLVGLRWGAVGIALAWVASCWIITLPAIWYAGRPIHLGIGSVITVVWKYVLASLLAGCASAALVREMPAVLMTPDAFWAFARLAVTSILFGVLYLGAVILLHRGCRPLKQLAGLLQEMTSRRLSTSPPPSQSPEEDSMDLSETARLCPEEVS
ncbi:MAG TPA: lipopolysaccharide biosynthesis protein [Terriglobales bacterium]|jgi:PST family polysaccharide transporter|nr:lipopolysaccharide biosynthesis protein [Terriglobales bacterium]